MSRPRNLSFLAGLDLPGLPPVEVELGSASGLLAPGLAAIRGLRERWDRLPQKQSDAARSLERQVSAIAQVCCDPGELERQTRDAKTAGEFLDKLLSSSSNATTPEAIYSRGKEAEGKFEYQKALNAYLDVLNLEPANLVAANAAGRTSYWLGDLKQAIALFYAAPKSALINAPLDLRAAFLNNYASALRSSGALEKAERLFWSVLQEIEPRRLDLPEQYSMVLNNLAAIQVARGDYYGADETYRKAIGIRVNLKSSDDLGLAQIHNNYAELKRKTGEISDAKSLHARALRTRIKVLGVVNLAVCESFNNLGAIARDEADYNTAEKCFLSAIDITEDILGQRHFQFGLTINNFGMLLYKQEKFEEAVVYLRRSVDIIRGSSAAHSEIFPAVEKNLMNVEIAAARHRVFGNIVQDSILIGPLTQTLVTSSGGADTMNSMQKVSGSTIKGDARIESDVETTTQEFVQSTAESLEMIIRTKRGREQLGNDLERVAEFS